MGFFSQVAQSVSSFSDAAYQRSMAKSTLLETRSQAESLRNQSETNILNTQRNLHLLKNSANRELSAQHAQAAASGIADSGTALVNEQDLATRLEQNIRDNAHKAMEESRQMNYQADLTLWKGETAASQFKSKSRSSLIGGVLYGAEAGTTLAKQGGVL